MRDVTVAITAASYSGNKGAAAMLQSSISQLHDRYGERLNINLMSVYPKEDRKQLPYDFIKVIPAKPEQILFIAFPLAVLYFLLHWLPPVKWLLLKNKILKAYTKTDLVLDEAGISFVDSRGFVMNTYAFVTMAIPMLMGVPVAKYSQAMGTFRNPYNRFLAKWILPKIQLICARGKHTLANLEGIGIRKNVELCADGAFTMNDAPEEKRKVDDRRNADDFYGHDVVGLSISSVVDKKCRKLGIDYAGIMGELIGYLNSRGYGVLMIANAARINSQKSRNNDLMVGDAIFESLSDKTNVRWYHEEMTAEEIREYIAGCRFLIASRFHAMIGALEKQVPVLLIGWSHKYQEVLDMFGLGAYAADFSSLEIGKLKADFERFEADEQSIRQKLSEHHDAVLKSSRRNIELVGACIDRAVGAKKPNPKKLLWTETPEYYTGEYLALRKGYAAKPEWRENAASGGLVTSYLCYLLEKGEIDGACVARTVFKENKPTYRVLIAKTPEEIRDSGTSVYMSIPLTAQLEAIEAFDGRVAVVLVPCMMKALNGILEKKPELAAKIVMKLGLYCSGSNPVECTEMALRKSGLSVENAERLYYRRGHWRGQSALMYRDGTEKPFSYKKLFCAYKNAYFFTKESCFLCRDQYASGADISFGDIWLGEMKSESIKHTSCVIRSEKALRLFEAACRDGVLCASRISGSDLIRSQKRALVFKYRSCAEKGTPGRKWNHRLVYRLARLNNRFSQEHPDALEKVPYQIIYYYMCFIRVLLSF